MADTRQLAENDSTRTRAPTGRAVTGAGFILELMNALLAIGSVALFMMREANLLSDEMLQLARWFDNAVCLLFASQATWNLWRSSNRKRWWRWGWADFLASIPYVEELRFLRWVRLLLVIRAIRSTVRSVHGFAVLFNAGRAQSVIALVFALIVVSVLISSFVVLGMETNHPNANIRTAQDALLWSLATLSGAEPSGFGDFHPVTDGGRIVNLWLVIVSLGLIGSLAGLISAWIEEEPDPEKLRERR